MRTHERVVGWAHALVGGLAIAAVVLLWSAAAQLAPLFQGSFVPELFAWIGRPVALAFLTLAGLEIAAAVALVRRRRRWSTVVLVGLSGLQLWIFPLGTALGAYTLWVLLRRPAAPA